MGRSSGKASERVRGQDKRKLRGEHGDKYAIGWDSINPLGTG